MVPFASLWAVLFFNYQLTNIQLTKNYNLRVIFTKSKKRNHSTSYFLPNLNKLYINSILTLYLSYDFE